MIRFVLSLSLGCCREAACGIYIVWYDTTGLLRKCRETIMLSYVLSCI